MCRMNHQATMMKRTRKNTSNNSNDNGNTCNHVVANNNRRSGYSVFLFLACAFLTPESTRGFVVTQQKQQQQRYRVAIRGKANHNEIYENFDKHSLDKFDGSDENEWGIPNSKKLPSLSASFPKKGTLPPSTLPNGGRVSLVGSGPGDPDLLTVKAYRILTEDPNALIVADRLVSQEILDIIPGEIKVARKLPGCQQLAQEEIYWWVYQGLNQGRHVIRLKIGDPFVFGRGGEEVLMLRKFGVEAQVVPGVSAAFSAPLLGSIPVTHRGVSNQVVMCTGYGRENTSPDLIQYHKEQTIVFLMAVGRLRELCTRLRTLAGYPIDTPVAIVEKAGCLDQRTVVGNMMTIADLAEKHDIEPPSTIVVGEVVNVLLETDETTGVQVTGLIQNMTSTFAA